MDPVTMGVMMGVGALQGAANRKAQQNANEQQANISAAQMEYSPWTKMAPQSFTPQAVKESGFGGAAQGALGGAMFSQANKKADLENDKLMAETQNAKNQANPWALPQGGGYLGNYNFGNK
jgi:hypothetical protein